jgi:death-on-curing protein
VNWITLEELLFIHEEVAFEIDCDNGILNAGGLETALVRPFTSFDGQEMFPDIFSKVAVLIHSLMAFHPFVDGNACTALIAAEVCLNLNGLLLQPSEEHAIFISSAARGEKSIEDIQEWLTKHTVTCSDTSNPT